MKILQKQLQLVSNETLVKFRDKLFTENKKLKQEINEVNTKYS